LPVIAVEIESFIHAQQVDVEMFGLGQIDRADANMRQSLEHG